MYISEFLFPLQTSFYVYFYISIAYFYQKSAYRKRPNIFRIDTYLLDIRTNLSFDPYTTHFLYMSSLFPPYFLRIVTIQYRNIVYIIPKFYHLYISTYFTCVKLPWNFQRPIVR